MQPIALLEFLLRQYFRILSLPRDLKLVLPWVEGDPPDVQRLNCHPSRA